MTPSSSFGNREVVLSLVLSTDHCPEVTAQLAHWPRENVIFQLLNRDTTPGILLPLAHISHREPFATVAIFPSDHFILDEARFLTSVRTAVEETYHFPCDLTLLGMTLDGIDEGYGWVESQEQEAGRQTRAVRQFWEKPSPLQAHALLRRGALWNTFVCVARANTLWEMTRQAAADLSTAFMTIRRTLSAPHAAVITERIYQTLRSVNFSVEVCTPLAPRLRVLPVSEVGWSDWGSVERICESLQRLGKLDASVSRLRRQQMGGEQSPPGLQLNRLSSRPDSAS